MSIYEYREGEHKSGFVGLRVCVPVKGKTKQRYYPYRKNGVYLDEKQIAYLNQCAKDLEKQWQQQQARYLKTKAFDCKEQRLDSAYTTGVRGIKMKFVHYKRHRAGMLKHYYTPVFMVNGANNTKRFNKNFNIMASNYDAAWKDAVKYYAKQKGIFNYLPLLERQPPIEKFLIIYKDWLEKGHDIPKERLPMELWGNSETWDYLLKIQDIKKHRGIKQQIHRATQRN